MNLVSLKEFGEIFVDSWAASCVTFGKNLQLSVVGHNGGAGTNKYYIVRCEECAKDSELFGEGYFKVLKSNILKNNIPCGCGAHPRWSKEQYAVLCKRKANLLGYNFNGFKGAWKYQKTHIKMICSLHGEWDTGIIAGLLNSGNGCPACQIDVISNTNRKPDDTQIASFLLAGAFHPETKFWRSERKDASGHKTYWNVFCPVCEETYQYGTSGLQRGNRSCSCNKVSPDQCYIASVSDGANTVALKFGLSKQSIKRISQINCTAMYKVEPLYVYQFPGGLAARKAELICRQSFDCGILSKLELPDGWSETTWTYNIDEILKIYEQEGGLCLKSF